MRTITTLLSALLFSLSSHAAQECQPDDLGAEDLAIMASVRAPMPTKEEVAQSTPVLLYVAADRGQLSAEDVSIMLSVQPEGSRLVLCPVTATH